VSTPTTEFNLIESLLGIISDLRKENAALTELLLQAGHLMPREESTVVQIASKQQSLGKLPWYQRKARLEKLHKPKVSELTGIPETDMQTDFNDNTAVIEEINDARQIG
jgi:hypothetical protein